jgi:hypothetical protein
MEAQGYTVVTPMAPDGQAKNGDNMYSGQLLSQDGFVYSYTLILATSSADAHTTLTNSVTALQSMGFVGSYTNSNTWSGTNPSNSQNALSGITAGTYQVLTMFQT